MSDVDKYTDCCNDLIYDLSSTSQTTAGICRNEIEQHKCHNSRIMLLPCPVTRI